MQIVAIGKPLFENRTELPEAVEYNYQSGDHTLLLSMKNLHREEIQAVREAEAEFGLYCENGIVFLLYRFGEALPWSDSAFSWWNVAEEDRKIPASQSNPAERILLKVILVEAGSGIVKAIRITTLSPAFTEKLHEAIRLQRLASRSRAMNLQSAAFPFTKTKRPLSLPPNQSSKRRAANKREIQCRK